MAPKPRCEALTRKGKQCPNLVDSERYEGKFLCHVHHDWGQYQLQLLAKRGRARARKERLGAKPSKARRDEEYQEMLASLRRQKGLSDPNRRR